MVDSGKRYYFGCGSAPPRPLIVMVASTSENLYFEKYPGEKYSKNNTNRKI